MTPKFKQPDRALGERLTAKENAITPTERRCYDLFTGSGKLPANFWHIHKTGKKHRQNEALD